MRTTKRVRSTMRTQPDMVPMATLAAMLALLTPGGALDGQQSLEMRGERQHRGSRSLAAGPQRHRYRNRAGPVPSVCLRSPQERRARTSSTYTIPRIRRYCIAGASTTWIYMWDRRAQTSRPSAGPIEIMWSTRSNFGGRVQTPIWAPSFSTSPIFRMCLPSGKS